MGNFTYDKVEHDFNSWNLTQGSASLSEYRIFLVLPASKTDPFRRGIDFGHSGRLSFFATYLNDFPKHIIFCFLSRLGLLAAITLQRNSRKELVSWATKETIRVIHFGGGPQHRQVKWHYLRTKYSSWEDIYNASRIHQLTQERNLYRPPLPSQTRQTPNLYSNSHPVPDPTTKSTSIDKFLSTSIGRGQVCTSPRSRSGI